MQEMQIHTVMYHDTNEAAVALSSTRYCCMHARNHALMHKGMHRRICTVGALRSFRPKTVLAPNALAQSSFDTK